MGDIKPNEKAEVGQTDKTLRQLSCFFPVTTHCPTVVHHTVYYPDWAIHSANMIVCLNCGTSFAEPSASFKTAFYKGTDGGHEVLWWTAP